MSEEWQGFFAAQIGASAALLGLIFALAFDKGFLARALNISLRTLHRHLHQEGASVQSLKDEVRCARAQDLLRRTRQPVKQVAHQLGFLSEKSFARAFRLWTGHTPSAWRQATSEHAFDPTTGRASGKIAQDHA